MDIIFDKEFLSELYYNGKCNDKRHRYQQSIVKRYIRVVDILESVNSTEDLYRFHALNYEVLVGDLKGLESVRVGDKYRLIFKTTKTDTTPIITICNIQDLTNHYK